MKETLLALVTGTLFLFGTLVGTAYAQEHPGHVIHPFNFNGPIYGQDSETISMNRAQGILEDLQKNYLKQESLSKEEVKEARTLQERARYRLTGKGIKSWWFSSYCEKQNSPRYQKLMKQLNQTETWLLKVEKDQNLRFLKVTNNELKYTEANGTGKEKTA